MTEELAGLLDLASRLEMCLRIVGAKRILSEGEAFFYVPRSSKLIKLPSFVSPELAYLVGYHLGDGYLEDIEKTRYRKGKADYEISYADESSEMLKLIGSLFNKMFNLPLKVMRKRNEKTFVARAYSKLVHAFMSIVLELPTGKRHIGQLPRYLTNNRELVRAAIRGFFDAEGFYYFDSYNSKLRIGMTNSDVGLLEDIKRILIKDFGIRARGPYRKHNQPCWELKIFIQKDIARFISEIGITHPDKMPPLHLLEGAT